jgi:hypothetical protein
MINQEEKHRPEYYEVGKHTKARTAVRAIKADIVKGEAYLVLQELVEIDSVLIRFPNPSKELRSCIHYEETMKQRQAVAERLEKILVQYSGLDKWKRVSENPYKVVKTTSPDEYDLIWNINVPSKSGKPKTVARVYGAYELGVYRLSLVKGEERIEYEDKPDTYERCEARLAEIAEQTITELSQAKKV